MAPIFSVVLLILYTLPLCTCQQVYFMSKGHRVKVTKLEIQPYSGIQECIQACNMDEKCSAFGTKPRMNSLDLVGCYIYNGTGTEELDMDVEVSIKEEHYVNVTKQLLQQSIGEASVATMTSNDMTTATATTTTTTLTTTEHPTTPTTQTTTTTTQTTTTEEPTTTTQTTTTEEPTTTTTQTTTTEQTTTEELTTTTQTTTTTTTQTTTTEQPTTTTQTTTEEPTTTTTQTTTEEPTTTTQTTTTTTEATTTQVVCNQPLISIGGSDEKYYEYLEGSKVDFDTAEQACEDLNCGAYLLTLETRAELDEINTHIGDKDKKIWTSLKKVDETFQWTGYASVVAFDVTMWKTDNEPDNDDNICAYFHPDNGGHYHTKACTETYYYICEIN